MVLSNNITSQSFLILICIYGLQAVAPRRCMALLSNISTGLSPDVTALLTIASATVAVGMEMKVGNPQVIGFRRNLIAFSPVRCSVRSLSSNLKSIDE